MTQTALTRCISKLKNRISLLRGGAANLPAPKLESVSEDFSSDNTVAFIHNDLAVVRPVREIFRKEIKWQEQKLAVSKPLPRILKDTARIFISELVAKVEKLAILADSLQTPSLQKGLEELAV